MNKNSTKVAKQEAVNKRPKYGSFSGKELAMLQSIALAQPAARETMIRSFVKDTRRTRKQTEAQIGKIMEAHEELVDKVFTEANETKRIIEIPIKKISLTGSVIRIEY